VDIRTKLVFVLVAVALGSMFALGWVMYKSAEVTFRVSRLEQLDGLAEAKKEGLEQIFRGWIDRVNLVATRDQLRQALREHNETGNPQSTARIGRVLSEAVRAVDVIEALAVYDAERHLVAAAGREISPSTLEEASFATPVSEGLFYQGVTDVGRDELRVGFVASITEEREFLGDVHIRLNGQDILDLAERDLGLGETGETLVVARDSQGIPRVLHRSRIGGTEAWEPVQKDGAADPVQLALSGDEEVRWEGVIDDWGEPVWAAVRYLPEAEWGLVVKVDVEEVRETLMAFRRQVARLTLSLGAFAILFGAFFGFRFARPIHDLAETANRIRSGEFSVRAPVVGEDEVSVLARTFNQMAGELENQVTLLREFRRYFEVSRDMLCIAGPDGYFKRINPAFRRTLGWNEQQLMAVPFLEYVHPDDQTKTQQEIRRLYQGLPTISFENRYKTPQGGYRHLMWTAHPDEETGLIYAIARDISEQKRAWQSAEKEMVRLRVRLKEAEDKLKGQN
jgi:PAS domain S-box-containing protein